MILALALVAGLTCAAYAEVQNVKISGDITVMAVSRNNLDLVKTPTTDGGAGSAVSTAAYDDKEEDLLSITRVRLDADLTDNVSTTVRLLNERNWNGESAAGTSESNRNIGLATANAVDEQDLDLDLAFVTLKEFLYSPLTLTVGRQELRFGNGWIVGDPDTNGAALRSHLAEGDLSARKSFDAIRATLDYDPLVIDAIFAKVQENVTTRNDDVNLSGLNAAYALDQETTIEAFYFLKTRGSNAAAVTNLDSGNATAFGDTSTNKQATDTVNTVGLRVVNKSIKNLSLDAQGAYQFGTYNPKFDPNARWISAAEKRETSDRSAWGLEIAGTYDLQDIEMISQYSPSVTAAYIYLSGAERDQTGNKAYKGWDPMFEDQTAGRLINAIMGFSNSHLACVNLKAKPVEDIGLSLDYVMGFFAKRYPEGRQAILSGVTGARNFRMGKTSYIGSEVDLTVTYDYTEDVQLSLLYGIFMPGKSINDGYALPAGNVGDFNRHRERANASEVIGSMKVTF